MPKEKKVKLFNVVGKFEIGIVIPADTKAEAVAYAQDNFPDLVLVDANDYNQVVLSRKSMLKFKVKKYAEPLVSEDNAEESGDNKNDSQQG
jgi:hypothetical protein